MPLASPVPTPATADTDMMRAARGPSTVRRRVLDEARWKAVLARRDAGMAPFVYAVTTTRVYCRPACPSRRPLRQHVRFFDDARFAEAAGFRPCRRCRPSGVSPADARAAMVRRACAQIDAAGGRLALARLADAAGLSRFHFQREFKRVAGMTPFEYARARRVARLKRELAEPQSIAGSIFGAGFGSGSRIYGDLHATLGMTPGAFRRGGAGLEVTYSVASCSLGLLLVATTARGVCAVEFGHDAARLRAALAARLPSATLRDAGHGTTGLAGRVAALVERPDGASIIPLDVQGTAFQRRVWKALQAIPVGTTASYADVAAAVGSPSAARAVARACAANPLAVLIPCHRVVRKDGGLGGYRWGVERKRKLVARERAARP